MSEKDNYKKLIIEEFEEDGKWKIKCPTCGHKAEWVYNFYLPHNGFYKCTNCRTTTGKDSALFEFRYRDKKLNKDTGGVYE